MINFNINIETINPDKIYVITRKDKYYSYFKGEFKNLPKDRDGNIIYPAYNYEEKESKIKSFLKRIINGTESISISKSSTAYAYFNNEYKKNIAKDINDNIIVPYQKVKK